MPNDVTLGNKDDYWVELQVTEAGDRRSWEDEGRRWLKKDLPEVTFLVHTWKDVTEGAATRATLTLYDIDAVDFWGKETQAEGKNVPFAKLEVELSQTKDGIAATLKDSLVDRGLQQHLITRNKHLADFNLRVGRKVLTFQLDRSDLHDELKNAGYEVAFKLEVGDTLYDMTKLVPTFVPASDPVEDMLGLPDRFSDPGRKPSLSTEDAPKQHAKQTKERLAAEAGKAKADLDLDGLRFDDLLDGSLTRRAFIQTLLDPSGPAMTGKTRSEFQGESDEHLGPNVLDKVWLDGDIVKAYFVVHDIGILTNNRRALHYRAETGKIRWKTSKSGKLVKKSVHGFLNWSGIYAPSWDFAMARYGTKASFKKPNPRWGPFTVEIENCPLPYYRPAPKDAIEGWEPASDAPLPRRLEEDADKTRADKAYPFACMNWKYPLGWSSRRSAAKSHCEPKPGKGEVAVLVAASPQVMIDGLVDLYVLASARAGHLLTVTTHVEIDRVLNGHSDPSGIDLDVFYEAITNRIAQGGRKVLPGLGGLKIPAGTRYGMHPRRLSSEPKDWNGIPFSRLHSGNDDVTFATEFPQQSSH